MKIWKKVLSLMLVILFIISAVPVGNFEGLDWSAFSLKASAMENDWIDSSKREGEYQIYESGADLFAYQYYEEGVEIISFVGDSASVAIPSEINGYNVVSIGPNAFHNIETLISVSIPDTVRYLFNSAFRSCDYLQSVHIGQGVTTIGDHAFAYCDSLRILELGDCITEIGFGAFGKCLSLESINLGDSVTSLGDYAFSGNEKLKSVVLGKNIKKIGVNTFFECVLLEEVFAEGVISVEERAFHSCFSLKEVSFSEELSYIGDEAFLGCLNLTELPIGSKCETIGSGAFGACFGLKELTFSESVNSIGANAFEACVFAENIWVYNKNANIDGSSLGLMLYKVEGISFESFLDLYTQAVLAGFYSDSDRANEIFAELEKYIVLLSTQDVTIYGYTDSTAHTYAIENNINFVPLDGECPHEGGTATCKKKAVCTLCGEEYGDFGRHTEVIDEAVAADCVNAGLTEGRHCSACGEVIIAQTITEALGHSDEDANKICDNCGTELGETVDPDNHIAGDINGDTSVNNKDLNRLMRYLAGDSVEVDENALDVNGDGNVNNKDLNRLMRYLAGDNVEIY